MEVGVRVTVDNIKKAINQSPEETEGQSNKIRDGMQPIFKLCPGVDPLYRNFVDSFQTLFAFLDSIPLLFVLF